ncbi:MAG TPA: response regulator [Verrucomicrobiae bacterium]|nr:response regulator [Verrucomicrobiae bacterium]
MDPHSTVLIIEDTPDDVFILKMALQREGIINPVQVVTGGQEAIDYLCAKEPYNDRSKFPFPKVLFTDLKMPRIGGFDVLQWLRDHPDCSVIPVIVLSASRLDEDVKRAYEMGANAYLVKPNNLEDLQRMVKTAFEFWQWCEVPQVAGKG